MKGISLEVRVGILILVALVLLGGFVFVLGGVELGEGSSVYVDFDNPGNVQPGAAVMIGSIRVGRVDEITYMGGRLDPKTGRRPLIRMRLRLDENVATTVHEDALFYVTSQNLLGEQIIAIDPGDPERAVLEEGAIIEGVDPPRMDLAFALMYELLESMSKLLRDNRDELDSLLTATANMVRQLDALLTRHSDRVDRIVENIEQATVETNELISSANGTINGPRVDRIIRNVDATLASVQRDIDPILTDVRSATHKVDGALDMVGPEEQENVQVTLREARQLAEQANGAVADAREIVSHIREGRGTVGAILMDEEIYDDIQEMLRDLKHNPWKLFWRE